MNISFHGAARGVTGSCHLVQCNGTKVLIDCGMFQGSRELREDNSDPFEFDPSEIDFLLLTHAHLDHCGRIPLLYRRGFRGEIITTAASRELARLVMLDSARLQEEDARYQIRKREKSGKSTIGIEPLYTELDALNSLDTFGRTADYDNRIAIADGIQATFIDAGHILGSASICLELKEGDHSRTVLFSGDIGSNGRPLIRDPAVPMEADVVIIESTYGDRLHKKLDPSVEELYQAVNTTLRAGGNVIIPTFAVERAQELLFYLHTGVDNKQLPAEMRVFLDSPMAISATEIFERHPEAYKNEAQNYFRPDEDPFDVPGLEMARETASSIAINKVQGGAIILAGSGMCTGGRVRHHLKRDLSDPNSSVIFIGYATKGTLARIIIDGVKRVRIHGRDIKIRANIYTIGGFSAHADQAELVAWHTHTNAETTFLVHGDEDVMFEFKNQLKDTKVEIPELYQSFEL